MASNSQDDLLAAQEDQSWRSEAGVGGSPRRIGPATWFLGLLLALSIAWTLRATMMVTLPLAAALFIALAVSPVCSWVQARVPDKLNWLGYVAAMLLVLALLAVFVAGVTLAGQQVADQVPRDPGQFRQLQQQITQAVSRSGIAGVFGGTEQVAGQIGRMAQGLSSYSMAILRNITSTVSGLVLVFFLVLLMLVEAPIWNAKLAVISGSGERWEKAAKAIGQRFRQYFVTRAMLGAITGLLYAGWLALFGVDLLIVWGLLAFLLNFLPTIGSLIAGILPVIYVFVTRDPGTAMIIAAGLLMIEQIMGNYVDPRLMGNRLALSSLVVLIALLFWSWIWGIVGALLAAPMTVLLVIVFAHLPALRPVALLLSNDRDFHDLDESTRAE